MFIEKAAILRLQMALQLGLLAERLLNPCKDNCLPEDFVKKQYRSISLLAVLALLFGVVTSGTTVFSGTIVKSGDKYMLQDSGGKSYDIDRQDLAKAHEGKQVRVKGTLDQDGKTIHVK